MSERIKRLAVLVATAALALGTASCSSGGGAAPRSAASAAATDWRTVTSAAEGGGLDTLVAAAKAEGTLNVITLLRDWANWGQIMDGFSAKYGIKISDAEPDGSSADEIGAITSLEGQSRAPDVVDVGMAFAYSGTSQGLFAPYRVQSWTDIPAAAKDPNGRWANDYGGLVSIGCNAAVVRHCPTSYKALDDPAYKGKVTLNGDPITAGAALAAVQAVSLAMGGSLDDVEPGIEFFAKLKKAGIYNPIQPTPATVESGETPIVVNWDYLNVAQTADIDSKGGDWKVVVPDDSPPLAGYYAQAISATAPHPAAARLWEEYVFSGAGQNAFLGGYAHPVEQQAMLAAGTLDQARYAKLPKVTQSPVLPTQEQTAAAAQTITAKWFALVG